MPTVFYDKSKPRKSRHAASVKWIDEMKGWITGFIMPPPPNPNPIKISTQRFTAKNRD